MKIIGCVLLIISTTAVGFYLSIVLKRRMMLFSQLTLLSSNLSTAIRYSGMEIQLLLKQEYENIKLPFISNIIENLENSYNFGESWKNALDGMHIAYGLSPEDKSIIVQFGSKLGTTDVEGQTEHCDYFKNVFQSKADMLKDDYAKKSKLYKSLGFFSGLAIAIVIL